MNVLLVLVCHRNPGMLAQKMLVFPVNEGRMHWSVTFVFNAGFIEDASEDMPRP